MANNQLLASDNFASGSLAAGWSAAFGSGLPQITSPAPFYAEPVTTNVAVDPIWTGLTWPKDQTSEVTIQTLTAVAANNIGLWVRVQSGSLSGYVVNLNWASGTGYGATIFRCDSGTFTQLGTPVTGLTIASGDVWAFQAAGAILSVYQNWKRVAWFFDATYTSGTPGFRQSAATVTNSQVASWRGYSAVQQDGIWQKQGTVIPALVGDLAATGSAGTYQLSNLIFEGNAQILSGTVLKGFFSGGAGVNAGSANIYYAESSDGINWSRLATPVITGFANPFWIKNGSTYYLYVQAGNAQGSGSIALYTATNSAGPWTQQSTTILAPGAAGTWDATNFFDFQPVAIIGGTWHALYTGSPSGANSLSMGHATSLDGLTWVKDAANPVLANVVNCGAIAQVGSSWYLWGGTAQPGQFSGALNGFRPAEVVRYKTADFVHWTNPVKSAHHTQMYEALNFNAAGAGGAFPNSIIDVSGKAYFYIQENQADGTVPDIQQISLAIGPAPIASIITQNEDAMPAVATDGFTGGTGSLGPNWTTPTGWSACSVVAGNLVQPSANSTVCAEIYTGAVFGNDQWSEVTIHTASAAIIDPLVRGQVGSTNCYFLDTGNASITTGTLYLGLQIKKNVGGVSTVIGPTVGMTPQVGDKIRLSVVGNVISAYQNGFLLIQVQDYSNAITSGSPGFLMFNGTAANNQISGFTGGNANVIPAYGGSLLLCGVGK